MTEMRHLLSGESTLVVRAVQAQSEDPVSVEMMTRQDLQTHLALRAQLGASEEELVEKLARWKDARDLNKIMWQAGTNVRTKARTCVNSRITIRTTLTVLSTSQHSTGYLTWDVSAQHSHPTKLVPLSTS